MRGEEPEKVGLFEMFHATGLSSSLLILFVSVRFNYIWVRKFSGVHAYILQSGIMAVHACVKPNMVDMDDDDGPIVFRRNKTTPKQNQMKSEIKKSSSQKHDDGPSGRRVPDVHSPNGQKSSMQKGKMVSPSIASTPKLPIASLKASTSLADPSKHSSKQNSAIVDMEKKHLKKPPVEPNSDSEDDKPLSVRLSAGLTKNNSHHVSKGLSSPTPGSSLSAKTKVSVKKPSEDSEDEIPLSSRFLMKSGVGVSASKSYDSDEEKPLASRFSPNGISKRDNQLVKSPKGLSKRPLGEVNTSGQSSVKKPKLSDESVLTKVNRVSVKAEPKADDDDHIPIAQRMKKSVPSINRSLSTKKTPTKVVPLSFKKTTKKFKKVTKNSKYSKSTKLQPSSGEGQKWTTLVHSGVIFPLPYKPHGVKMLYNGKPVELTPEQEEVATMFAVMKDTEYATKQAFLENFMNDWRVILGKNHVIKKFDLCDFTPIYEWHEKEKEKKKQMSTEEKKALKEEKLKQEEKYMWAIVDGVKEKVGNFRVEPPGLFRGRGEHPKMGKLKRRIRPSDITINIGKSAPIPECPIPGERWKEVKHDNTVTWLAFWNDPINPREFKYVFLAASSSLKGQSDKEKYEKARLLKDYINGIRATYTKDFISKDPMKRQIAVATYLIDKLALRAGNEKDDDEADTVGCCTLKMENVELVPPNKLQFDFLGKDSIRYFNTVEVEVLVYKAIGQFKNGKKDGDDLFDKLDTSKLNAHLKELMPGLTAKVFRTYNASITLDEMLNRETKDGDVAEKVVVYQHANKEVAIICNHQRSVSKSHSAQMSRLNEKMDELKAALDGLKIDMARAKKGKPPLKDADGKPKKNLNPEAYDRKIAQINAKIEKMERDMKTKEDLKTVALGTSKINYLDPRISVAWCKRHEVPIEKIFNKSLLAKFAWAMDVDPSFRF
ncbi:hypothetical protein HHK36_003345 [Tetracentron sinense]|uniref:DNA topoisomerase I n=1 Tax=Tetracentron sinense TaxID=13715 RepID=A0A835DNU8_TETSI|nr:hypothetical protein HHK36_003345 [Tetracentron sinense]